MLKRKIYYVGLILSLISIFSCNKKLDLYPTDTFTDENAFQTIADVQAGAYEAYARFGSAYSNNLYVNALLSDEAALGVDNSGQGALTYKLQFSADATTGGDVISAWGSYYTVIDQINRVLYNLPTVTAAAAQEPRRKIIKGQLLGLRGMSFFELLQAYTKRYDASNVDGIPLVTAYSLSNLTAKPSRNTVSDVIKQINEDFDSAATLLQNQAFSDTAVNIVNVNAYRARLALYMGEYQKAVDYSTTVINSSVRSLANSNDFPGIWKDSSSEEILFKVLYTGTGIGGLWTTTGGLIYISPSNKLIASYNSATDIRYSAFVGKNSNGYYYVNKYYTSSLGGRIVNEKVSRIAELYLIRAEANAHLGNISASAQDLNVLRSSRISNYVSQSYSDESTLLSDILVERYKELCFEGLRYFDLKRNSMPLTRLSSDASAAWQNLSADSYRWVLPIPQSELNTNPNISQTPGY